MLIDFDPAKNRSNLAKHGLPFEAIAEFDFETAIFLHDDRRDYGETRIRVLGWFEGRVYALVFVPIEDGIRAISFRKANVREVRLYEAQSES